jgi:hypothetical protein
MYALPHYVSIPESVSRAFVKADFFSDGKY